MRAMMQGNPEELRSQALNALARRDPITARSRFKALLELDGEHVEAWLGLAFAESQLDAQDAALAAVDRCLELAPQNLRALIFRGDHLLHLGQSRKALAAYRGALIIASRGGDIPADVAAGLKRAERAVKQLGQDYEAYLRTQLDDAGYRAGSEPRFDEALAIAFGSQRPALPQPTRFYYPGLPAQPFYRREDFSWSSALEAQTGAIRAEALELEAAASSHYEPYLKRSPDKVALNDSRHLGKRDWGAFYLRDRGTDHKANLAACPATARALDAVPLCEVPGNMPHVLFSRLAPGTVVPPHHGLINTRLICHLPLIVPEGCGVLRCGNEARPWRQGELLIFDDSIEHEASNPSPDPRVVLIFDVWRPELNAGERRWISELLQIVLAYEAEDA